MGSISQRWAVLSGRGWSLGRSGAVPPFRAPVLVPRPAPARSLVRQPGALWLLGPVWVWLARRLSRLSAVPVLAAWWDRLNAGASWLLRGPLAVVLSVVAGLMLAAWIPHYLTWPWWTDTDHFAVTAQSWQGGALPYRDLWDFNFPGPVYLLWFLGRAFGWGRTAPYYAVDAGLLLLLGAMLAWWSWRRWGRSLPGLVGGLLFVAYYLGLDFAQAAQRDWQAALLSCTSVMLLEARRDRTGRVLSGLTFATALVFRPHVVLLLPAAISALDEHARRPSESWRRSLPAAGEWAVAFGIGLLLVFAPLLWTGTLLDLIRWLRLAAHGGHYERKDPTSWVAHLYHDLGRWETSGVLAVLVVMAVYAGPERRRAARTWAAALLFVLLYKPLSPVVFPYHDHPQVLVSVIGIAVVVGAVLTAPRTRPAFQVLTVVLVLWGGFPGVPRYCSFERSVEAVAVLVRGETPRRAPLGCAAVLPDNGRGHDRHSWQAYCDLLDYLRKATSPETRVANFLRRHPWPPVNGPVGRLTVYPCAEGLHWLRWVAPDQEDRYAERLAWPGDVRVVWNPRAAEFERLAEVIRQHYRFEARFGCYEVWRRRCESETAGAELTDPVPGHAAHR